MSEVWRGRVVREIKSSIVNRKIFAIISLVQVIDS